MRAKRGRGVRLLHTSDVHMDVLGDRRCRSLTRVVDLAIERDADLIVIAGDMFDRNRVKDDLVEFAVAELNRGGIPVVILPGNHDCLVAESVFHREAWKQAPLVNIFREPEGETFHLPEVGVSLWGRPLLSYGDDADPLEGLPAGDEDADWHIAVAHGYFREADGRDWASFQISAGLVEDSGRHYVALGDSHAFKQMSAGSSIVCYSGSPSSGSHTVAIVELGGGTEDVAVSRMSTLGPDHSL